MFYEITLTALDEFFAICDVCYGEVLQKLFAKIFQEQENGTEVFRRLGLLQKTGPGPIDSQGTNACY